MRRWEPNGPADGMPALSHGWWKDRRGGRKPLTAGFRDRGRGFNVLSVRRLTLPEEAWRKEGRHSESGRYTAEN